MKLICLSGTKDVGYEFLKGRLNNSPGAILVDCECSRKHLVLVKEDLFRSLDKYVDTDETVVVITYNDVVYAMLREYVLLNTPKVNLELKAYKSENSEDFSLFKQDRYGNINWLDGVLDTWDDCVMNLLEFRCD